MNNQAYLQELAAQRGLTFVAAVPFKADPLLRYRCFGTAIGEVSGYLVAISLLVVGNQKQLGLMVRFPKQADVSALKSAIEEIGGIKALLKMKSVRVNEDSAQVLWGYAWKPPKSEEILQLLNAIIATIANYAPAFGAKCEGCGTACKEIILHNEVPSYYCVSCQGIAAQQQELAARAYDQKPANYTSAILLSGHLVVALGVAEGLILYWFSDEKGTDLRLWVLLAFLAAIAVGKSFAVMIKKIDSLKQGPAVFAIALLGNVVANVVYFSMFISHSLHAKVTVRLALAILLHLPVVKFGQFLDILVSCLELFSAGFAVYVLHKSRPQFVAVFRPVASAAAPQKFAAV